MGLALFQDTELDFHFDRRRFQMSDQQREETCTIAMETGHLASVET